MASEEVKVQQDATTTMTTSEEDALAFKHVQELASIQTEIQALRAVIPSLISPLLRPPNQTAQTPAVKGDPKAQEIQLAFSQRATQVQQDVKALVKKLENMCDTLEAAEHVRHSDHAKQGDSSQLTPELQRSETLKEFPELVADPIILAPPIQPSEFLFNDKGELQNAGQLGDFDDSAIYDEFGLSAYLDN